MKKKASPSKRSKANAPAKKKKYEKPTLTSAGSLRLMTQLD